MRILSQDGLRFDIEYENCHLVVNEKCFEIEAETNNPNFTPVMASYSSVDKCRKVMEMLREQYAKLCSLGTYLQGGMELFAKSISQGEAEAFSIGYKNMNIFQFLADDEVET